MNEKTTCFTLWCLIIPYAILLAVWIPFMFIAEVLRGCLDTLEEFL